MPKKPNKLTHPPERGYRVGTKRSDRRWIDEHGELWASRFESKVYEAAKRANVKVRKCDKGGDDTFPYSCEIRDGRCQSCQSTDVIKERRYTPDLCVLSDTAGGASDVPGPGKGSYYVEAKGYLRAPERALLRSICAAKAVPNLHLILQSDYKVGAGTLGAWIDKFLHIPWTVFTGEWPTTWSYNVARPAKKAIRKVPKDL